METRKNDATVTSSASSDLETFEELAESKEAYVVNQGLFKKSPQEIAISFAKTGFVLSSFCLVVPTTAWAFLCAVGSAVVPVAGVTAAVGVGGYLGKLGYDKCKEYESQQRKMQ